MKSLAILTLFASFVIMPVMASVTNFDNLGSLLDSSGFYYDESNPTGFTSDGFQFDMALMNETAFNTSYRNTGSFPSSSIAVYSNGAYEGNNPFDEITISRLDGRRFDFIGANIGGFTYKDTIAYYAATSLEIQGYRDGQLIDSVTVDPLLAGFNFLNIGLANIDTLKFIPTQGTYNYNSIGLTNQGDGSYWMMDNFTYTVVPAPGAILLAGLGVSVVGWFQRKRVL